jgi:hypothetical protein
MLTLDPSGFVFLFASLLWWCCKPGRRLRIEEPFGLWKGGNQFHIAGGGCRVTKARPKADAWVS